MTKQQSILLDILLTDFTKGEYRGNGGFVNIEKVIDGNEKLKNLSDSELNKLLYLIRVEQIKIGIQLLSGSAIFTVFETHIKDFLNVGGFKKLRLKKRNEFYFKWTVFIITILTFIVLIYSTFFQENLQKKITDSNSKNDRKEILRIKTLKDSVKINSNKKNDLILRKDSIKK